MYVVKDNKVYSEYSGEFLENPSILVDGNVLLGVGEFNILLYKHKALITAFKKVGLDASEIFLLPLLNRLDVEDACYVINVSLNYTGVDFVKKFASMYFSNNLYTWLGTDKERRVLQI